MIDFELYYLNLDLLYELYARIKRSYFFTQLYKYNISIILN
jgi:hypothetical protein